MNAKEVPKQKGPSLRLLTLSENDAGAHRFPIRVLNIISWNMNITKSLI